MKKIRNSILWIAVIVYLLVVLAFVAKKRKNTVCNKVQITILDSAKNFLLEKKNIEEYIHKNYKKLEGTIVDSIDIAKLEKIVLNYPLVKTTKMYKNISGEVFIELTQRKPIIRIITAEGKSFYIDEDGIILPFSETYTAHVLVANGNIVNRFELDKKISVESVLNLRSNKVIKDLFTLGKYIYENEFFKSQTNQIYVTKQNKFELVPRVGQHIVIFGTIEDYKNKFKELEVFYKEVLPRKGWNDYETINLSFKNQIVCKKK